MDRKLDEKMVLREWWKAKRKRKETLSVSGEMKRAAEDRPKKGGGRARTYLRAEF